MSRKFRKNAPPQNDYPAVVAPASMEDFLATICFIVYDFLTNDLYSRYCSINLN